jgi:protein-disulfide isomerase
MGGMFGLRSLLAGLAIVFALTVPAAAQSFNAQEQAEIRALMRDYLLRNPEVLEEAITALQARRKAQALARIEGESRAFSLGPRNAPITIVEFFDYQCRFCHAAMDWVFATARARNDVRVVFMEMPGLGPASEEAARAAVASIRQGRYEPFHRALMANSRELNSARIDELARSVGVDVTRMRRDMRDPAIDALFADVHQMASDAGGAGTPFFLINGTPVSGFDRPGLDAALESAARATRTRSR